jgi:hypothetical protein
MVFYTGMNAVPVHKTDQLNFEMCQILVPNCMMMWNIMQNRNRSSHTPPHTRNSTDSDLYAALYNETSLQ